MALAISDTLRREFTARAEAAAYERFRKQELDERRHREREDRAEQSAEDSMDIALAVISVAEADAFRVDLDTYDAATVEALQLNDVDGAEARKHLDLLMAKAHILPDGRRVFKTENGTRVFDEHGHEIAAEEIQPNEIADSRPRWETVEFARKHLVGLEQERTDILEYQQKLDDARERLDAVDMTKGEFEELHKDLKTEMPDAVRELLPEQTLEQAPQAVSQQDAVEIELDIEDDMVPTAAAPRLPVPGMPG